MYFFFIISLKIAENDGSCNSGVPCNRGHYLLGGEAVVRNRETSNISLLVLLLVLNKEICPAVQILC